MRSLKSTWIPRFLATHSPQLIVGVQRSAIVASLQAQRTAYQRQTVSPKLAVKKNVRHDQQGPLNLSQRLLVDTLDP